MMSKQTERGFSLIEVVVALGVLSTAAISFSALSQNSVSGVSQLETRYLARTVADAQLVDVFTDIAPIEIGVTSGTARQMGRAFEWVRTISPSTQEGLFLVNVQVSGSDDGVVLAEISTLKGGAR